MIPKFEEFIKEGLWSKGIDRSKSGEERLETKVILNTNDFKEIDLGFPFVFADIDLTVNGEERIDWFKFVDIKSQIEKTGWRLPGWHELKKYIFKFSGNPPELNDNLNVYTKYEMHKTFVYVKSKKTDETLNFIIDNPYGQSYWCDFDDKDETLIKNAEQRGTARIMRINEPKYSYQGILFSFENEHRNEKLKIRLVKDKHVNEGLWSKGIDRSKSGEERLEDKSPMYMVCKKMSEYLSEQYKQECIFSISKYEPKGTVAEYDIEVHVNDVDFILHVTVPLTYNDDEVKCGDCVYDAIVGEILYNSDGKSKGQYKKVLKIMNKGIRKIYGFE